MSDSALNPSTEFDEETLRICHAEMGDHLDSMEKDLLSLEGAAESSGPDLINGIFRAAHSIKGTAAFIGLEKIKRLSHAMENVLGQVREGKLEAGGVVCAALLEGTDLLRSLLNGKSEVRDAVVDEKVSLLSALLNGATHPVEKPSGEPASHPSAEGSWTPVATPKAPVKSDSGHVRVNVTQLDKLMALAGELVLTRNALIQSLASGDLEVIAGATQRVDSLTSELQDGIMLTRMQPIGSVLGKFRRIVRDLAHQLGKQIDLAIEGEEVEVDKSIIEAIGDPLTHLIRNAVDHGIEMPSDRLAAGKPSSGNLRLRAFHEAGQVWIDVEDDGGGIHPAKIKAKALENGLRSAAELAVMADKDITTLIFAPGFSTANSVSDVSGRGVGMDVVQTGLAKIGGAIDIESKPGSGTRFRIRLPLTLAIIPTLLVQVGEERFALPQVNVAELVRVPGSEAADRFCRVRDAEMMKLRGAILPLVNLKEILGITSTPPLASGRTEHVAVVSAGEFKYGIRVDGFLDSMEIVVKPFGKHLAKCLHYAGATILGDGQVALILDVAGISKVTGMAQSSLAAEKADTRAAEAGIRKPQSFLLVEIGPGETFALPMDRIVRIERIPTDQIESVGCRKAYSRREGSLVLLSLEDAAQVSPRRSGKYAYAVAFNAGGREVGFLVSEILDTIQGESEIETVLYAQSGILGAVLIGGKLTLVPNLEGLAAALVPGLEESEEVRT